MKLTKSSTDLSYSSNGDFFLSEKTGDLRRENTRSHNVTKQIVIKRLEASRGDWRFLRDYGANLNDFIGQPNTAATGELIKANIVNILSYDGLINPGAIMVDVAPVGPRTVLILLKISAPSITEKKPLVITFTYDMRHNKLILRRN